MAGPSYHGRTHLPGGTDPIPGLSFETHTPFYDAVADLAATRDLRGYWRLGEGGQGPYQDTSGHVDGPVPMVRQVGSTPVLMTDVDGALPAAVEDDGAVQFNSSTGAGSDWLQGENNWGTAPNNRFQIDMGTIAGWIKPFASASTFVGGILHCYVTGVGVEDGWSLGVKWPSRRVYHTRGNNVELLGPVLAADEWVFVVGVKDATSTRIYLNGAPVAVGPSEDGASNGNAEPEIGTRITGGGSEPVVYAAIDEVSCWGDALTDSEIATLAAAGGLVDAADVADVVAVTGAYTAFPGEVVLATGTFTVTLPTAVGISGSSITVKNAGVGTITVGRTSSETIDAAASDKTISTTKAALTFTSDGIGWQIVSAYL